MSKRIFLSLLSLGAAALPAAASAAIIDGGFETQAPAEIGGNPGYCYSNDGGGGPQCTGNTGGGTWVAANGGGFQDSGNSAWPGTATPDGHSYGFIQNAGSLSQLFTASSTGNFVLNFLAAGRNNQSYRGDAAFDVFLGGNKIYSGTTTTGQAFTDLTSGKFGLTKGQNYTLTFQGITVGADNTAFIDRVGLSAVPEPATWAMIILGIGMIGGALRRRQQTALSFA